MSTSHFFTSESVCAGHPDKVCDQISDAILDEVLRQDPQGRVAVETLVTTNQIILAGEVTTTAKADFEAIAHQQVARLGYSLPELEFTTQSPVSVLIHQQSPEIAQGVDQAGAGDQGMMFGFACRETPSLMPLPITLAHALAQAIDQARETTKLPYLRPDGKTQVTVRYEDARPAAVEKVVVAVPHDPEINLSQVTADIFNLIITPTLTEFGYSISQSQVVVNGTGVWHIGGPASDTGLTGRKIVVDTYGGYARVGGGCFSGKDPTKVDRSGAYAARYLAKNIVAAGLADKAEIGLAYCIGLPQPVMKSIETFDTAKKPAKAIMSFVDSLLDCSVTGIIEGLHLRQPLYLESAAYGHFGQSGRPWEQVVNDG